MALVQVGMGLGRVVLLVGAGMAGSVVIRDGRFADFVAGLQEALRDNDGGGSGSGGGVIDQIEEAVKKATMEVNQMISQPVTVITVDPAVVTTLIAPAAAAGALTYGYMRWKGISIASLMYVTKQNMANAVASMTKHLEQVQSSLAAAKRHLTQRIQHLDDKLDQQKQISGQIKEEVTGARLKLQDIGSEMQKIKQVAHGLGGKLDSIEAKQNYSLAGVMYLVEFIEQNGGRLPRSVEHLQRTARLSGITGDQKQLQGLGQLLAIESATPVGSGLHCTSARLFKAVA
ncbi:hypothetical protein [Oryza sativa Japonica Group]|uniref:DUF1664 domain-containing protein n=2 Tax=Oryza sativa subsp. japonica TaxID=39947 RepID=A2ZQ31_ORYSJ|nr:uncharacterized protein LOC107276490 isoform X2 [Oryza sativa Japonica Group]EAZ10828.1 hypothetical protein OsJ_00665 [Oryza sativa Japonica Group]BAB03360.1 hypothetical protein [Oryza sativa Japonica Group]